MDWVFPSLLLLSLAHYPLPSGVPILLISVTKKNRKKRKEELSFSTEPYWGSSIWQSSGYLHPLLSWRCLSLQLLAKWGYQAYFDLSLLCEWYGYDLCGIFFFVPAIQPWNLYVTFTTLPPSILADEWLAVIIPAYEYRNRIRHCNTFKGCVSLYIYSMIHFIS